MSDVVAEKRKVLLVDDCISERDLYEAVLETEFDVVTAERGLDALVIAAAERPDAVVLDVVMPGLDGWETCTRLKVDPATADTPVVLLTGVDDPDLFGHAMAVGADGVEHKPCAPDRLLDRIHGVITKRGKAVWGS